MMGLSSWICVSWVLLLLILLQFLWWNLEKRILPLFFQRQQVLVTLPSHEKAARLSGASVQTTKLTDAGRSCHLRCLKLCLKMCVFCS